MRMLIPQQTGMDIRFLVRNDVNRGSAYFMIIWILHN